MKLSAKFSLLFLFALFLAGCNERLTDATEELPPSQQIETPAFGSEATLEIASWNIEMFPKSGQQTIESVKELIRDLDIDLFAIQEITDEDAFAELLDSLPDYDGRLGTGASDFALWPAVIYKKDLVTVLDEGYLFTNDSYHHPRAPYRLHLRAEKGGQSFDFTLLVLHLKASGGAENEARRREAIRDLENYVEAQVQNPANDPDFIIAGDWNDLLNDPASTNVFEPFLSDTADYRFLTAPFAGSTSEFTYIGGTFNSLIDHIMITRPIGQLYPGIATQVLKIDQSYPQYEARVSDHRPVAARIAVF